MPVTTPNNNLINLTTLSLRARQTLEQPLPTEALPAILDASIASELRNAGLVEDIGVLRVERVSAKAVGLSPGYSRIAGMLQDKDLQLAARDAGADFVEGSNGVTVGRALTRTQFAI